jgi:quinol monooxygenase YgiN
MIVIHATVLIDASKIPAAIAAAKEMMEASRKEAGCQAYTFAQDLSDPARFHIIEEWDSDEVLAKHFATPHMAKFQQAVGGLGVREMKADKFGVSSKGPIR